MLYKFCPQYIIDFPQCNVPFWNTTFWKIWNFQTQYALRYGFSHTDSWNLFLIFVKYQFPSTVVSPFDASIAAAISTQVNVCIWAVVIN